MCVCLSEFTGKRPESTPPPPPLSTSKTFEKGKQSGRQEEEVLWQGKHGRIIFSDVKYAYRNNEATSLTKELAP